MSDRKPIEVCITVDTEFSIGGNFGNPEMAPIAQPIVLGMIGGQEHGLGFILDSLAEFGVRATFFVETLQTAYFGDEPMREIARRIAAAGHDVQLHLHPCWLHYEAPAKRGWDGNPDDSCAGRSDAELDNFFGLGLSAFSRWSLPPPIAVRAGNFQVDENFYRAAARWRRALSSSVVLRANGEADKNLAAVGVWRRIGQVLEFPVFSYTYHIGMTECLRVLAVTACSHHEILSVLKQAYHKAILRFLSENTDKFVTLPISAISQDGRDATGVERPSICVPARAAIARMIENGINDRIWWY